MSIVQFEQLMGSGDHRHEDQLASRLSAVELTERAAQERLSRWQSQFKGVRARQVLLAVADASAILDLPVGDVPADPAPDSAAQAQMLAAAAAYIHNVRPRLPNFLAVRTTTRFEVASREQMQREESGLRLMQMSNAKLGFRWLGPSARPNADLFFIATTEEPIAYRNGVEIASPQPASRKHARLQPQSFASRGEFGPILSTVAGDAFKERLAWSHWKAGPNGKLAVFRYSVPITDSHFAVYSDVDSLPGLPPSVYYRAYHGEIAISPADGAVYHIMIVADADPTDPALVWAVEVEYSPVDIGAKTYTCPVHAVALSTVRDRVSEGTNPASGPLRRYINDITFTQYHVFRSESRILPSVPSSPQ